MEYTTAWVVTHARCALTVAGSLMELGLRPGKEVSLICQEYDEILDWCAPPVTSYVIRRALCSRAALSTS